MADINVVRKTPAVWPWVIGLGLVLMVAVLWFSRDSDTATSPVTNSGAENPGMAATAGTGADGRPIPAEVAAYRSFIESPGTPAPGLSHDYAATGIRRLSGALRAVAGPAVATTEPLAQKLAKFEKSAARLQVDPKSMDHADIVRNVFVDAVNVMTSIQEAGFSGSIALKNRVDDLRRLAESIEVNRPLLDQQQRVSRFFDQSAETLAMLAQQ
jgi:hypothetical protein